MCKAKRPTVAAPPAATPPPSKVADEVSPAEMETDGAVERAKRRGRNALVIPMIGGATGGAGLNIPVT